MRSDRSRHWLCGDGGRARDAGDAASLRHSRQLSLVAPKRCFGVRGLPVGHHRCCLITRLERRPHYEPRKFFVM
jgi:hypothetical protein